MRAVVLRIGLERHDFVHEGLVYCYCAYRACVSKTHPSSQLIVACMHACMGICSLSANATHVGLVVGMTLWGRVISNMGITAAAVFVRGVTAYTLEGHALELRCVVQ